MAGSFRSIVRQGKSMACIVLLGIVVCDVVYSCSHVCKIVAGKEVLEFVGFDYLMYVSHSQVWTLACVVARLLKAIDRVNDG